MHWYSVCYKEISDLFCVFSAFYPLLCSLFLTFFVSLLPLFGSKLLIISAE